MLADFGPAEIGIILVIVLVLFGGAQLPKLAKNLGKAQKEFKDGLAAGEKESKSATTADVTKSED
ncbi:hypothetical protein BH10ACT2_BH10ACT2_27680 [soil metagenome]